MRIVFTGGGTGGHIYPGLSVAEKLNTLIPGLELAWIGNEEGMDREIIEKAGIEFIGIPSGKFRRDLNPKNLLDVLKVGRGFFSSLKILGKRKPALLFSKGGYVSVPPCAAAKILRVPVFAHESDVSPGLATRLTAGFAERIFVSYPGTIARFPEKTRDKLAVSGNPVRSALSAANAERGRAFVGAPEGVPILFVVGGSQGARQINELLASSIESICESYFVVHQTGRDNWEGSRLRDDPRLAGKYKAFPYIGDELPDVLASAQVVLSRAGAGSVWESAALGKPMILVPLEGPGTRGDQILNAKEFEEAGAAICLSGEAANPGNLSKVLSRLAGDKEKLARMKNAQSGFAGRNAALFIAEAIKERISPRRK